MRRLTALILVFAGVAGAQPHAQGIPVFDVAQIAQMAKMVVITELSAQIHKEIDQTITRMSRGLPGMERYLIPGLAMPLHDVARYLYAGPILSALNTGDHRATKYYEVVRTLTRDLTVLDRLPPDVRQIIKTAYAQVEILDSTNHQAINQVGTTRVYNDVIGGLIDHVMSIVTNGDPAFHQLTSVLDSIALTELVSARQNTATTQTEANLVAQQLAKSIADRNARVAHFEMTRQRKLDAGKSGTAIVAGFDPAWEQP